MFQIPITKEELFSKVSEEEIFERYLNTKVVLGRLFTSTIRKDNRPTCSFYYSGLGRLMYRDWAYPGALDCIGLVMRLFGLNYNDALEKINNDFKFNTKRTKIQTWDRSERILENKESKLLYVDKQPLQPDDLSYYKLYNLNNKILEKYQVHGVKSISLNDRVLYIRIKSNPCVGYYFGNEDGIEQWKIYFYLKPEYSFLPRFIGNTSIWNGYKQLPDTGDLLIITKSMKDVMVLHALGYNAIAPQAETIIPSDKMMDELKDRFQRIYTFYDFDKTGISSTAKIKRKYDIRYIFLTNGRFRTINYGAKDISDYVKLFGFDKAREFIKKCV